MYLPSLFLGISLAFLGAAVGCFVVVHTTPSGSAQFWTTIAGVVFLAFAIGAAVSAVIGFREDA
ncbi:MAG: hypothetical protein KatS3mg060_1668 [Dehalococcoidia bacterium]|nr:MAG: hypothetical protein KatS3mg060_1668 [Dehalococcoidia bacterium]